MCGICGIVSYCGPAGPGPAAPDDGPARAPGAGRQRMVSRPTRGAGPHPARHHRHRGRRAATLQRGRHRVGDVQRGDLQLRRARRGTAAPWSHLPDGERHRGDRARLGGVGRGVLLPLQRPVGPRTVGPACGAAGALPRPARGTPAVLYPAADGPAVRVRGEVHLRRSLGGARLRPCWSRPDLHLLVAGRAPHGVPRHRAARARALRRPRPGRVPEGSLLAHHVP